MCLPFSMKKQKRGSFELEYDSIFHHKDILNESLVPFIDPMSLMCLVRAIPGIRERLHASVYTIITEKIYTALKKNIPSGVLHRLVMQSYTLTGGALLAALTNATWIKEVADIDLIQVVTPPSGRRRDTYDMAGPDLFACADISDRKDTTRGPTRERYTNMSYPHSDTLVAVCNYENFTKGSSYVQMLSVLSMEQYVQSFDFEFCRNYMTSDKLVIYAPMSVLRKRIVFNLKKYLHPDLNEVSYIQHTYLPGRYARLCKYLKRGYDIRISSTFRWWDNDVVSKQLTRYQGEQPPGDSCYYTTVYNISRGGTEEFRYVTPQAIMWTLFWEDRIDMDTGIIDTDRPPKWKHGEPSIVEDRNL